jgi:uncharacterized protein YqjF (DUF2071 family)
MANKVSQRARLQARQRPSGAPIMHQDWGKLLFMHWPVAVENLRPLIPEALEIDTYEGQAWIAITPFTMWDIRPFPPLIPPIPGLSSMHELNVRTYVHFEGVPGVWFFSLDANSRAAVMAARNFFYLPYHHAEIDLRQTDDRIDYELSSDEDPPVVFDASWTIGDPLPEAEPESLPFFLTERYCLYTEHDDELYRARIHHAPWPLQTASLIKFNTNILEANELPQPASNPMLHYAEEISVDIWPLEHLGEIDDDD